LSKNCCKNATFKLYEKWDKNDIIYGKIPLKNKGCTLKVTLINHTPLTNLVDATRICHASQDKSDNLGEKDLSLLKRVILQSQHTSLMEFVNYTFLVESVCGSTLLQLTRHRHGSYGWHDMGLAVQSSRHTLKRTGIEVTYSRNKWVNAVIWIQKMLVRFLIWLKIPNDDVKLALPQAYNYNLYMTINARSLGNLLSLRLARNAHYDIREMSQLILDSLPEEHRFLFTSCENQGETV
jgi:thymidylate synthase (FAD)